MASTNERQIFVENIIRSKKIQTFEQILKHVSCSEVTLRRDIRRINPLFRKGFCEMPIFRRFQAI